MDKDKTTSELTELDLHNINQTMQLQTHKEFKDLYNSIWKLVQYNYNDERKSFAEEPSQDHIMIDICRIKADLFPNKKII